MRVYKDVRFKNETKTQREKRTLSITWVQVDFLNGPGAQIVFFAHEFVFVYDVQFLPRGQLLVTHHAGKAVQVKHLAAGFADQVVRRDSLQTARTFCAESPGEKRSYFYVVFVPLKRRNRLQTDQALT